MQRHAFRSVCGRTRPELEQVSDALRGCIRHFSTTQLQADDSKDPSKPASNRERSRTATTEINALARSRSPVRPNPGAAGAPKVLDVKNLPKLTFRGRGGFRGGAARGDARGGTGLPPRLTSPLRDGGRSMRGRGGFGGRGGRGGRGRGGAKRFTGRRKESDEDKDKERKPRVDEFARMDPDEQAFDDSFRFGAQTKYSPSLTLESLTDFAVVAPSTAAGKAAAVVENLNVLGTADNVGAPQTFQARHYATDTEKNGLRFFADPQHKVAAEEYLQQQKSKAEGGAAEGKSAGPIITDAEEAVRKVILQSAVKGQHETPKFASDPVGVSRSWHLRAETYTTKDVDTFETKLTSLLSRNAAKSGGKAAGKAKA